MFDRAGAFLREVNLDKDSLTRSIIATARDSDPYQLPEARGYAALCRTLTGETDEQRRELRDSILSTTAGDVRAVADALDVVGPVPTIVRWSAGGVIVPHQNASADHACL